MKRSITHLSVITFTGLCAVNAADIPIGIEWLSGLRSEYLHRGIQNAGSLTELQLQSSYSLSQDESVELSLWQLGGRESSFAEYGVELGYAQSLGRYSMTPSVRYREIEEGVETSTAELGFELSYRWSDDFATSFEASYQEAEAAILASLSAEYSYVLTDDSYVVGQLSIHSADDYHGLSGLYDVTGTLRYIHHINDFLTVTPFAQVSEVFHTSSVHETRGSLGLLLSVFF